MLSVAAYLIGERVGGADDDGQREYPGDDQARRPVDRRTLRERSVADSTDIAAFLFERRPRARPQCSRACVLAESALHAPLAS